VPFIIPLTNRLHPTGQTQFGSLNGDKLSCLDIAVLMRNTRMVRLLQQHNAKESSACKWPAQSPSISRARKANLPPLPHLPHKPQT